MDQSQPMMDIEQAKHIYDFWERRHRELAEAVHQLHAEYVEAQRKAKEAATSFHAAADFFEVHFGVRNPHSYQTDTDQTAPSNADAGLWELAITSSRVHRDEN